MAPKFGVESDVAKRLFAKRQENRGESSAKPSATSAVSQNDNAVLAAGDNKPSPSSSSSQSASTDNGDNGNGGGILGGVGSIVNGATSQIGSVVGSPTESSSSSTAQATSSSTNNNPPPKQTTSSSSSSADPTSTQTQDNQSTSIPSSTSTTTSSSTTSSSLTLNPVVSSLASDTDASSSTLVFTSTSDGTAFTVTTVTSLPSSDPGSSPTSLASQTTSGSSSSFFNNKPLVGAVFGVAGLVGLVLIISVLTFALRRARRSRLENDAADVDGTINWSADAGVGGTMGYSGMPIIGQLERGGSPLNRNGSGRSNSSRNASDSPIGSEDGLLGARSTSSNGYYNNYGASAEGPAPMANLGRRPSNGEQQQLGMTMNNAMPVSMGMPLNRAVSVSRQEGAPVNVPGQPFVPPPVPYGISNVPRAYGGPQQQVQVQRQSIGAYAFQQPSQLPYAQPRSFSPPNQQQQRSQQAPIGAYPTAQHGRNASDSDGANTFGRTRSGSDGTVPDSPGDEGDYYAEYNYGGAQTVGRPSELRVANK